MYEEEGDMEAAIREAAMERAIADIRATEPPLRAERWIEHLHRLAHLPYVAGCDKCDEWREEAVAAGLPE